MQEFYLNKYSNSFINTVISSSVFEQKSILNEVIIYEEFLDSIKTFLSNRYEDTIEDLSNTIRNTKDAAIVIKEIIKNEEYLTKVLEQLNKKNKSMLKQLRSVITEYQNTQIFPSLSGIVNKIIQKLNYFLSLSGWKGFISSLGIYSISRYILTTIVETKNDINKLINLFSPQSSQNFQEKIDNFFSMIGQISSLTMNEFMGYFSSMGDILSIMLNVLSDIKKRLSINVKNLTLTNEVIKKRYSKYKTPIKEITDKNLERLKYIPDDYNTWVTNMKNSEITKYGKVEGYDLYKVSDEDSFYDYIVLLDHKNKKTVAQLRLTQNDQFHKDFYIVKMIKGNPLYSGKNIGPKIYSKLVRSGINFISDDIQSEGGKKLWSRLVNEPGVYVYAVKKGSDGEFIYSDVDQDSSDEIFSNFEIYNSQKMNMIREKIDDIEELLIIISKDIKDFYKSDQEEKAYELEEKYEELYSKKEEFENLYYTLLNKDMDKNQYYTRLIAVRKK